MAASSSSAPGQVLGAAFYSSRNGSSSSSTSTRTAPAMSTARPLRRVKAGPTKSASTPSKTTRLARRQMMMDEDEEGTVNSLVTSSTLQPVLDTRTTSSNSTITSTTTPSSSTRTSTITPDKFKLHFAGRVYRPLEYYASSQEARSSYTTKGDWLGQPDERVEDKDAVIDCPCGDNSDKDVMIQCDECDAWQHCPCVGYFKESDCPEHYVCSPCRQKKGMRGLSGPFALSLPPTPPPSSSRRPQGRTQPTLTRRTIDSNEHTSTPRSFRDYTPPPSSSTPTRKIRSIIETPDSVLGDASPYTAVPASSDGICSPANGKIDVEEGGQDNSDDDDGLEVLPSSPASGLCSSPSSFKRTPTHLSKLPISPSSNSSPRSASTPASNLYNISRNLLSQIQMDNGSSHSSSSSPSFIRPTSSHPLLSPSKKRKRETALDEEGDMDVIAPDSEPQDDLDPATVPLPEHYTSLLNLHSSVERALLLHLATEGSRAASVTSAASSSSTTVEGGLSAKLAASQNDTSHARASEGDLMVDLPNLVSYSTIRGTVERGSKKKFGLNELGQLIWLWEGGLDGPNALEHEGGMMGDGATNASSVIATASCSSSRKRRGGLSISVSSIREMDKRKMGNANGKRVVYNWGIGINLTIKQNKQLPAFEIVDDSPAISRRSAGSPTRARVGGHTQGQLSFTGSPGSSGSGSSSSGSTNVSALKRTGMSVLPLWSSKSEYRKHEMRSRLGRCVIKAYQDFQARSEDAAAAATRSADLAARKRSAVDGGGGGAAALSSSSSAAAAFAALLPTPPPSTRKQPKYSGIFAKGFILDALPPIPSATLPTLGPATTHTHPHAHANGLPDGTTHSVNGVRGRAAVAGTRKVARVDADVARMDTDKQTNTLTRGPGGVKTTPQHPLIDEEEKRKLLLDEGRNGSSSGLLPPRTPKAPANQRAMSLLERIKAKEQEALAASKSTDEQGNGRLSGGSGVFGLKATGAAKNAARQSLEMASMRAKYKEGRRSVF